MGHVGPLGEKLNFFVFLGTAEILGFSELSVHTFKLSYSKPFHNTLNYASTANIEEAMKFYNLGDKTFETDFSTCVKKMEVFENTSSIETKVMTS